MSASSTSELERQLLRLDGLLAGSGAGVHGLLAPGAAASRVHAELEAVGLHAPSELVTWFGWHDGLSDPHPKSHGDGTMGIWTPYSLTEAIAEWRTRDHGDEAWEWQREWLPLATKGREYLVVRCGPNEGEEAVVRVVNYEFGLFSEEDRSQSLSTAVRWWCDALTEGIYFYVPETDCWDFPRWVDLPFDRRVTGLV